MVAAENIVQRYEKYKDSGISWLEQVPEHWELKRFKHIFQEKKITHNVELNCGSISFGKVVFKDDEKIPVSTKKSYQVLNKGEFLINPLNLNYDLKSLRIGLSDKDVVVSSGYIIVQNKTEISKDYYKWLLHIFDVAFMKTLGSGVRQTLSFTHIANSELVFPPLSEQNKIAQFLDNKTTKIDDAIAIKEQQINLLKERKQILIHKAVTRGLNDSVTLKDSGVEWIGEIPEHWEVKRLKYILKSKLKYGANESGIEYDITLPRYVRITDFGNDGKLSEESKLSLSWNNGGDYLLKDGDILFARSGATVGKTYQFKKSMSVENNYCFAGYLIKAEANEDEILSDFLYLYTNSELFNKWKDSIFIKATIENIGADKYAQLPVILPSIKEQKEILLKYEGDNKKIETAIGLKQQEIAKLKEYKSSLINEVVTGKVKVC
ncbi:restriction endonuclease subunit S [Maribacter litoralis]|uniref:Restriction endonuclease subunit S n=1 Tax=Maribacter litoralis TaxID=2059726 RepID=A0A653WA82_9FLAO|nr:restriction endonuclease subunit S [Maribacter litoralis]VXC15809.1 Restriction endonuclease subunit S [Maribacter litoralis]